MNAHRTEIYHPKYNLSGKDNLRLLPAKPAVYALFAIIEGEPVHCRYVGYSRDLQAAIRSHFEQDPDPGLRGFMQGPWIKMLLHEVTGPECSEEELKTKAEDWERQYAPFCDPAGEYSCEPVELYD